MLKRFGLLAICTLMFTYGVSAHVEAAAAAAAPNFSMQQNCISASTSMPQGWAYPGTILTSSSAGIEAMEADWQSPQVVANFTRDTDGNFPLVGGQLSPNEDWYAEPFGAIRNEPYFHMAMVQNVRLYSLSGDNQVIVTEPAAQDMYSTFGFTSSYFPVQWRDNQSLMIAGSLLHPFANSAEVNAFQFATEKTQPTFSPDLTRVYAGEDGDFYLNGAPYTGLFNPSNPQAFHAPLNNLGAIYWRPDSAGFMAYQSNGSDQGLTYYTRDGEPQAHILDAGSSTAVQPSASGRTDLQWSPDGNSFAFTLFNADSSQNKLYLVDWQKQVVTDTCLTPESAAVWSPDGTMFAYLAKADQNLNLVVVDVKTWQSYIAAQQSDQLSSGSVAPEIISWRAA